MESVSLHITPSRFDPKAVRPLKVNLLTIPRATDTTAQFEFSRTLEDVERVKELTRKLLNRIATQEEIDEYLDDPKGALNRSDLERIKYDIHLLGELLHLTLNESTIPSIPDVAYFTELLEDVDAIRNTRYAIQDLPLTPSQPLNNTSKFNDIEFILYYILQMYLANNGGLSYANGELYMNDNDLL